MSTELIGGPLDGAKVQREFWGDEYRVKTIPAIIDPSDPSTWKKCPDSLYEYKEESGCYQWQGYDS